MFFLDDETGLFVGTFVAIMLMAGIVSLGLHIWTLAEYGARRAFVSVQHRIYGRQIEFFRKRLFFALVAAITMFVLKSVFYLLFDFGVISQFTFPFEDAVPSTVIFGLAATAAVVCVIFGLMKKIKPFTISFVTYCTLAVFFDVWTLCWQFMFSMNV